jgi:hypothetical protein
VLPLLYRNLKATCREAVPESILLQLRDHFADNARRNLFLTGQLLRIVRLLEAKQIPVLPFKGPILASLVYGDLSLRTFWDLDVLVRTQDVLKAKDWLISEGYRQYNQYTSAQEKVYLRSPNGKDFRFVRDDGGVIVELHWRLACSFLFRLEPEQLWKDLTRVPFVGETVLSFSPEALLLILCVHGAKHYWQRLEWVCDVAELIRSRPELDWNAAIQNARQLGSERLLLLGLFLANDLLEAPLPEWVRQQILGDRQVGLLAAKVRNWLFRSADDSPGFFERHAYQLKMKEGLRDLVRLRIHYWFHYLGIYLTPTARDRAVLTLPAFLSFIYYLIRPIRLAREYALHPLKDALKYLIKH